MREQYHDQLDAIRADLVTMSGKVATAMERASQALLASDLPLAESVIASDVDIDEIADRVENECLELIALQAPVAGELRTMVGALRISATLERMGDLAEHIALTVRHRFPDRVVPEPLAAMVHEMGELATRLASELGAIIDEVDVGHALRLELEDDRMDELHRQLLMTMLNPEWQFGVESAIELSLVSRFYERFADHAVSVARRIVYQATGQRVQRIEQG